MSAERLAKVAALFDRAISLEPDDRVALFRDECADDPELAREVDRLLRDEAVSGDGAFIERAVRYAARDVAGVADHAGLALGPYRLIREVGRGGMGSVWLAERADAEYTARVAVKLVQPGPLASDVIRRFKSERQILASLEHPNIARLLDGGTSADGVPYLVMEYVEGRPVTRHADESRHGLRDRLVLFRTICDAVGHAHRNLVVHRDIKPGNILVTADGAPKLLDFGIAKLLEPGPDGALTDTVTTERVMTPAYASPEQVRGERITTATDVYALGLLLYELLTGRSAHRIRSRVASEVERAITTELPERPSDAVLSAGEASPAIPAQLAAARDSYPERLRRDLAGDLDTIILKALEKEPARRYVSVDELGADIGRYLAGEPVLARPATPGYRLRKFVSRHRVPVAAGVLLVASLAGGLGVALWQAREAREARGRAEASLGRATEVTRFLSQLFRASDPRETRGDTVTARELLERATARIDSLAGQPVLQADLLNVIGPIYTQLGQFEKAAGLLERSAAIRRAQPGVDTLLPETVNMWSIALQNARLRDSAAVIAEQALELGLSILGEKHPTTIAMLNSLAIVRNLQGRDEEAEALYRRTIALQTEVLGKDHTDRTYPLNNLGLQFATQGRYREAEPLLRETQRILIANRGEEDALTAFSMENTGMLLREAGRYDEAEPVFRRGLAVRQKVLGPAHRFVGESYFSLGLLLALRGRPDDLAEADTLLPASLAIHRATLGPEHPAVGYSLYAMAVLAAQQGDTVRAVRRFRDALAIRRQNRDAPRETIRTLVELGTLLRRSGDYGADSTLREAHDLGREGLPAGDPVRSRAAIALSQLIAARGNVADAGPLHREALAALRDRIGADHPVVRQACAEGAALGLDSGDACPTPDP